MPDLKEDLTHRSTADSRAAKLIFCSRFLSRGRTFFALPRRPPRVPFARDGVLEVYRLSSELQSLSVQRDLLKRSIRNNLFRWLFKNPVSFFLHSSAATFHISRCDTWEKADFNWNWNCVTTLADGRKILNKMDILFAMQVFFFPSSKKCNSIMLMKTMWCDQMLQNCCSVADALN